MNRELQVLPERLAPQRGLVLAENHRGERLKTVDILRWLRVSRLKFGVSRVDVLIGSSVPEDWPSILDEARGFDLKLSLRVSGDTPAFSPSAIADLGLSDLCIALGDADPGCLDNWIEVARECELPIRVWLTVRDARASVEKLATWRDAGVCVVHLEVDSAFSPSRPFEDSGSSEEGLTSIFELVASAEKLGIEMNVLDVPFCKAPEEFRKNVVNGPQGQYDHNGYAASAYAFAARLYDQPRHVASRILKGSLARETLHRHPADEVLIPWLLEHDRARFLAGIWRRMRNDRHRGWFRKKELPPSRRGWEENQALRAAAHRQDAECASCALSTICEGPQASFRQAFPGLSLAPVSGDRIADPLEFGRAQPKFYDSDDTLRTQFSERQHELAGEASAMLADSPADRRLDPKDYGIENAYFERFEGGLKWFAIRDGERISTSVGDFTLPFMIAFDIGGGLARRVGFSIGRRCRIVCDMIGYRHSIALFVDEDGAYALLRDGKLVRPIESPQHGPLALRLPDEISPCIVVEDIEESVTTHNLRAWTRDMDESVAPGEIDYTVLIVSTRFTRRLQAVLRCLAHQDAFDLGRLEIVVCYVPGVDATDDLLDSVASAYPALRIVRSPFSEKNHHSKGFMINESIRSAHGRRVVLLDSDTLVPPNFFALLEAAPDSAEFIAPDGRKLLTPEVTGKILLGEIEPWNAWGELLDGAGTYRRREAKGVPVGFCQVVTASILKEIPYLEMEHFEWADMAFGKEVLERVGKVYRLSGVPVLHLDHGSSQWFGTQKHY